MKVRGHSSVTLLFPSRQVLSTRVGEDEEGSRALAWAQAAVSREPVTPLRQLGAAALQKAGVRLVVSSWLRAVAGVLWLWWCRLASGCLWKAFSLAFFFLSFFFFTSIPDCVSTELVPLPKASLPSSLAAQKPSKAHDTHHTHVHTPHTHVPCDPPSREPLGLPRVDNRGLGPGEASRRLACEHTPPSPTSPWSLASSLSLSSKDLPKIQELTVSFAV